MCSKEIREWIKLGIELCTLITAVFGVFFIKDINVNLDQITATSVGANNYYYLNPDGTVQWCAYVNETGALIEENPCPESVIKASKPR